MIPAAIIIAGTAALWALKLRRPRPTRCNPHTGPFHE